MMIMTIMIKVIIAILAILLIPNGSNCQSFCCWNCSCRCRFCCCRFRCCDRRWCLAFGFHGARASVSWSYLDSTKLRVRQCFSSSWPKWGLHGMGRFAQLSPLSVNVWHLTHSKSTYKTVGSDPPLGVPEKHRCSAKTPGTQALLIAAKFLRKPKVLRRC